MSVSVDTRFGLVRRIYDVRNWSVLLGAAIVLLAVGCGKVDHGDRLPLSGTVTVQGKPLAGKATIFFDPVIDRDVFNPAVDPSIIGSAGEVTDGQYTIPVESGPTPGVTCQATIITASGNDDGDPNKATGRYQKTLVIPERDASTTQLDIDFGTESN